AIENKTNLDAISRPQIVDRHAPVLGIKDMKGYNLATKREKLLKIRWHDIYDFFSGIRPRFSHDRTTDFLLGEFIKYLEVIGLAGFTGFDDNDFARFVDSNIFDDPQEQKRSTKNKFCALISELDARINKMLQLKTNQGIRQGEECKAYFPLTKDPHYSVYMNEEGVGLDVILVGSALVKKFLKSSSFLSGEFIRLTNRQKLAYELAIFDKVRKLNRVAGSRAWGEADWIKVCSIATKHLDADYYTYNRPEDYSLALKKIKSSDRRDRAYLNNKTLPAILKLAESIDNPAISIRKFFPPHYAVKRGQRIIEDLVLAIKDIRPLFEYLKKATK
ncbi:MAG: hypothetical protein ABID35_05175, partial [Candidatus Margulisiibacteriota bacterium]